VYRTSSSKSSELDHPAVTPLGSFSPAKATFRDSLGDPAVAAAAAAVAGVPAAVDVEGPVVMDRFSGEETSVKVHLRGASRVQLTETTRERRRKTMLVFLRFLGGGSTRLIFSSISRSLFLRRDLLTSPWVDDSPSWSRIWVSAGFISCGATNQHDINRDAVASGAMDKKAGRSREIDQVVKIRFRNRAFQIKRQTYLLDFHELVLGGNHVLHTLEL